jgi:hypothetical protein
VAATTSAQRDAGGELSEPTKLDLAAAALVVETKKLRNEARALGHENLAWRLGKALDGVFDVWKRVIAAEDQDGQS